MEVIGTGSRKYCEDIDVLCFTGRPERVEILKGFFFWPFKFGMLAIVYPELEV